MKNEKVIDFLQVISRLLLTLNEKERDVIDRRFSLNGNKKKETLDKIGKSYLITRERVRQIESGALHKLSRASIDPSIRKIYDLAFEILEENGKVMAEELFLSKIIQNLENTKNLDINAIKLTMHVSKNLQKIEKSNFFKTFWCTADFDADLVKKANKKMQKILQSEKKLLSEKEIFEKLNGEFSQKIISSVLYICVDYLKIENKWGLKKWRFINPKSIKDRILVIFKNHGKPMHFSEITTLVLNSENQKTVTPQAVHNELIRHDEFVLVGRGVYAIREWNLAAGTVCDILRSVFLENDHPLKRNEIIEKVLQKREIRVGTISLNLQKYPFFKRVGRAVYEYDKNLEKEYYKTHRQRGKYRK